MSGWDKDINDANETVMQLYQARDFTAISNFYTENCSVMPPGSKLERGRQDWENDIKKANAKFMEHYKARDFTALSNLYTEDCSFMPPGAKFGAGRQAVVNVFSTLPGAGIDSIKLTSNEVTPAGDIAVERGRLDLYKSDGTTVDVGKYVVVWKRIDKIPKLYTDIWNSDSS